MKTLRRCVFNVSHIEIKTPSIEKETSVTRRLFLIPVVWINRAGLGFSKKIVLYLGRPELGIDMGLFFAQKAAVFGFYSNNPIHRLTSIRQCSDLDKLLL